MDGAHIIDVNALLISIASTNIEKKAKFPLIMKMERAPFGEVYDVYKPSVVSIGPYHHKSEATKEMEQFKWESLQYILRMNPKKKMRDYLEAMAELEQQIRSCYAGDIKIGSEEFIKMMLLDGCFILCTLYWTEGTSLQLVSNVNESGMRERNLNSESHIHDPVTITTGACGSQQKSGNYMYHDNSPDSIYYSKHWYTVLTTIDLVILENQIPFFVVVKLFEVVTNGNIPIATLLENVARFLKDLLLSYPAANFKLDRPEELHHLLHLCHLYFKPNELQMKSNSIFNTYHKESPSVKVVGWHRAVEYFNAGIEVKKRENCSENAHYLLDIAFNDGVMEIPCLTIEPNTYCLFQNLIAFEETCPQFGNYMTAYVVFLSQFITMPEDVSLLTKRGIIVDQLDGDAEIFDLFKMLAQGVPFDFNGEYYLKHICHDMEVQYQMQRPRWRDWLGSIGSKLPDLAHEFPRR